MSSPIIPNFIYIDFDKHGRIQRVRKNLMLSFADCFRLGESASDCFLAYVKANGSRIVDRFNLRINNDAFCSPYYHYKYSLDNDFTLHITKANEDNCDADCFAESKSYVISITAITAFVVIATQFYRDDCFECDIPSFLVDEPHIDSFDMELLSQNIYRVTGSALLFTGKQGIFANDFIS